jgi:endonuclease/exonuclease/phosphatase family metal-dependent hydrolase
MIAIASPTHAPRRWLGLLFVFGLCHAGTTPAATLSHLLPPASERTLSVATLSLAGDRWSERRDGVLALLTRLRPDVIALQDVMQTPDIPNQACWLAAQLNYGCSFITADPPSRPRRVGNALLTRLPIVADAVTLLHPFEVASTAGMVQLDLDGTAIDVYVTHLYPDDANAPEESAAIRAAQVRNLLRWIDVISGDTPALVVGDMAAAPESAELRPFTARYRNALPGTGPTMPAPVCAGEQVYVRPPLRAQSIQPITAEPGAGPEATHGLLATIILTPEPASAAPLN